VTSQVGGGGSLVSLGLGTASVTSLALVSREGWVWASLDDASKIRIPSQSARGKLAEIGNTSYFTSIHEAPVEGEDPIITKDNGVGGTIVVTDPETQTLEFPIEGEDTADLASANYYCKMTVDDIPVAIGMMTILTT